MGLILSFMHPYSVPLGLAGSFFQNRHATGRCHPIVMKRAAAQPVRPSFTLTYSHRDEPTFDGSVG